MAKLQYIYIIIHDSPQNAGSPIVAAFTDRDELKLWYDHCIHPLKSKFHVYSVVDYDKSEDFRARCKEISLFELDLKPVKVTT